MGERGAWEEGKRKSEGNEEGEKGKRNERGRERMGEVRKRREE